MSLSFCYDLFSVRESSILPKNELHLNLKVGFLVSLWYKSCMI